MLFLLVGLCGCAQHTEKAKLLQEEVDNGHRPGLLDPHQVIYEFLEGQLRIPGSKVQEMR